MRKFNGNLSLMPVADLIQWADNSKRSGTLILNQQERQKKIYLQDGKIIFIWSNCEGEHFGNFLKDQSHISQDELDKAFSDSEFLGLPFIGYLLSEKIFTREELEEILKKAAEVVLISALKLDTGVFEFADDLPAFVSNSPIRLNSIQILFESLRCYDEGTHEDRLAAEMVLREIHEQIEQGNFELPPIPDVMMQLAEKMDDPAISIDEIIECITDQILVSKILRICNSPFYGQPGKISSLKEAVVLIGLKSLMSIVSVHAMSSFSPRNGTEIKKILQHCLVCGMIARQVTRNMGGNYELAFICGLLHDIGKTILLDMLGDYMLPSETREKLIEENHAEVGYLLAQKWNFTSEIKDVIRYHHTPEKSVEFFSLVEVINLSNAMVDKNCTPEDIKEMTFASIELSLISLNSLLEEVDKLDYDAGEIVGLL
ncbi:MAG: HDOD domain-containing protein [Desulfuromonadaceae bacterium]|nr:HDOD domain-containing protein [Desulfuromonadaceae bacterium]MDD5104479.1 HDOD domain-containing protein [Desulfuromonadaceae bacterium]